MVGGVLNSLKKYKKFFEKFCYPWAYWNSGRTWRL